jgi:hypothetical protein
MFPFPIATPQGCNIQTFYGTGPDIANSEKTLMAWNKPVGVSHVYMMLIGGGGNGDGATGGGSGAVTVWYGAAQHVPNSLVITPGIQSDASIVSFRNTSSLRQLLLAQGGSNSVAGPATTAPAFAASGFYKSTAGQDGASGSVTVSSTTFLSGGAGSSTNSVIANYGYTNANSTGSGTSGFFQLQPIIIGVGGSGVNRGGIGCGGGGTGPGTGGPGMVLIASW